MTQITKSKDIKVFLTSRSVSTTLSSALSASESSTISLKSGSGFPISGGWIRIGSSEVLRYSARSGNTLTLLQRDFDGESHSSGALVELLALTTSDGTDSFRRIRVLQDEVQDCFLDIDDRLDLVEGVITPSGVDIEHSALSGLSGDDHTQYTLVDGSRAFTGTVGGITPVSDSDLTTKLYVDTEIDEALLAVSSGNGVTDHGALTGLLDDDHTQYPLVDGTRGFTGVVPGIDPVNDEHLATKLYVDTEIDAALLSLSEAGTPGHYQETFTASGSHTVTHGLGAFPQTFIKNSSGVVINVRITHTSINELTLTYTGTLTNAVVVCDTLG